MGARRNSTEIQQSGHAPRSGPKVKNGRSSAKDGASERLRCKTIQKEVSQILQRLSVSVARTFLLPFSSCIGKTGQEKAGKMLVSSRKAKVSGRSGSCEKDFVSKKSSGCAYPNLCNNQGQRAGNMDTGEYCSGFGGRVHKFITGKTSVIGDPL